MNTKNTYQLGAAPIDEECAQLGTPGYAERALKECNAFRNQLVRMFQAEHNKLLPEGCNVRIKPNSHDFGIYYQVEVVWDMFDLAEDYAALWLDANLPEHWDELAKAELAR